MNLRDHKGLWAGLGVGFAVLTLVLVWALYPGKGAVNPAKIAPSPPSPFALDKVRRVRVPIWYQAVGVVGSVHKATLSAQISGVVGAFDAALGDVVSSDRVVVKIVAEELEARKARMVSQLAAAEAQNNLAIAHFERTQDLYKRSAATREQFEQAEQRLSDATASVVGAREGLREAQIQLDYGQVASPYPGVVAERFVDPGDYVWPGRPLFAVYDPDAPRIEVTIPERYVQGLSPGLEVEVEVEALGKVLKARVAEIRPHVDPKTRAFVTKCDFTEKEALLHPGMYGTLHLRTGDREALLIPRASVLAYGQLKFVWVQRGERWQKRYVTLGRSFAEERVEVLSGLSEDESIAVIGKV